jgi:hypothetical protein
VLRRRIEGRERNVEKVDESWGCKDRPTSYFANRFNELFYFRQECASAILFLQYHDYVWLADDGVRIEWVEVKERKKGEEATGEI